ncbi:hypothetical protein FB45DRAFT_865771 [Roridomyces roridus]|uniref:Uncharacterized protein n=1 Tax=Roridomyces roridus TaxID=1738132 RepID=A0AAD7F7I9_9AGAR|nr:hypothetical protein FB45DRAFT_882909 [Roridomyces roridus]KAJ7635232.1 hypothetical protein FB45DRAFT_865771 [Roridomyces roridus]
MSRAEFEQVKSAFLGTLSIADGLRLYQSSDDGRRTQLADVGAAASRMVPFTQFVVDECEVNPVFKESLFTGRSLFHTLHNPKNDPKVSFPPAYDAFRKLIAAIHERRSAKKESLPKGPKKKPGPKNGERAGTIEVSDGKEAYFVNDAEPMVVDEDSSSKNAKRPSEKPANNNKGKKPTASSSKRPKTDRAPEFHEDAFLTSAVAEFFAQGASAQQVLDEVTSIVDRGSNFENDAFAMRKRMYSIMVEIACLHEQFRSLLIRRQQLTEEGLFIRERLQIVGDVPGVDPPGYKPRLNLTRNRPSLLTMSSDSFTDLRTSFILAYDQLYRLAGFSASLAEQREHLASNVMEIVLRLEPFTEDITLEGASGNTPFTKAILDARRLMYLLFSINDTTARIRYPKGALLLHKYGKLIDLARSAPELPTTIVSDNGAPLNGVASAGASTHDSPV